MEEKWAAVHLDRPRQKAPKVIYIPVLGRLEGRGHLIFTELPHGESTESLVRPCRDLAVMHVGCNDHACFTFVALAVQDHHVLGVRGQPRLHGLTYGTDLIQRWGVEVRPAKVMNLWI